MYISSFSPKESPAGDIKKASTPARDHRLLQQKRSGSIAKLFIRERTDSNRV